MHYYFVGLTATGNFTALSAMQSLGFTTRLYPTGISQCAAVDAVAALSVAYWFRREQLPLNDAQLVLTVRADIEEWLAECERRYMLEALESLSPLEIEVRRGIFGQLDFSASVWRTAYTRHVERCGELAAKAGKVLHIWDAIAEPTWDFLCALTGRRASDTPFPLCQSTGPIAPSTQAGLLEEDGPLRRAPIQVRPSPLGAVACLPQNQSERARLSRSVPSSSPMWTTRNWAITSLAGARAKTSGAPCLSDMAPATITQTIRMRAGRWISVGC